MKPYLTEVGVFVGGDTVNTRNVPEKVRSRENIT